MHLFMRFTPSFIDLIIQGRSLIIFWIFIIAGRIPHHPRVYFYRYFINHLYFVNRNSFLGIGVVWNLIEWVTYYVWFIIEYIYLFGMQCKFLFVLFSAYVLQFLHVLHCHISFALILWFFSPSLSRKSFGTTK